MGQVCGALTGQIPNLMALLLKAALHELNRRRLWIEDKILKMEQAKKAYMDKALEHLKNRDLLLAFAEGKSSMIEGQKIEGLRPTVEALKKTIEDLSAEIKKEEAKTMDANIMKEQLNRSKEILEEIVTKWIKQYEDMIQNPDFTAELVGEIAHVTQMNPIQLFEYIKKSNIFPNIDESAILLNFNPQLIALKSAKDLIKEKELWMNKKIEEMKREKDQQLAIAREKIRTQDFIGGLTMLQAIPVYETKLAGTSPMQNLLKNEIQKIEEEIKRIETEKPNLEKLSKSLSQPEAIVSEVMRTWVTNQGDIASNFIVSYQDAVTGIREKIPMNPVQVIGMINKSGLVDRQINPSEIAGLALPTAPAQVMQNVAPQIPGGFNPPNIAGSFGMKW